LFDIEETPMNDTLKKYFSEGLFGTGWRSAVISLVLAVAVYFTNGIYDILNHGPAVWILRTPIDDALPVVKPFVIPYVSLNYVVYFTLIVFLLCRTKLFHSAALAMITAFFVSYFFYFFFQTEVIRPVLTGTDLFTRMIQNVYAGDNPYNDFPSLHTSISTLLAIHWFFFDRRAGIVASIWTALIVASTVFIKQHYVPDLISGLLLASGASWLYIKLIVQKKA
jgi:membrane-associated phospholipid phosphatase